MKKETVKRLYRVRGVEWSEIVKAESVEKAKAIYTAHVQNAHIADYWTKREIEVLPIISVKEFNGYTSDYLE